ncbi:glucosyl-3-phosphoglycerate synthase [Thermoplasmatales archaeon ex4572_165]|nr:MAG: glucosyl-3-phosphoglycerate synthase [Thermoplasmatales archaeon ex4572_165]RLF59002.1 MAG: glucosyl-3-phosphoglycerate synthase [Thermoplasmata archaeon]
MDLKQERITTLHEFNVNKKILFKTVSECTAERPASLVLPMLYREITNDALGNIKKGLNKCTYLNEIVIPLSAKNEKEFTHVKNFFSDLKIPHLIMWCNGPKIEYLLKDLQGDGIDLLKYQGKGRDVWLALGIATLNSYVVALHDADIVLYDETIPTKLLYPLVEPELDYKFNKGYYARVNTKEGIMYGRVVRLFLNPLLEALMEKQDKPLHFAQFLFSFRYPLSGEFALTSDLARDVDIPGNWGLEIGIMAEMFRNVISKRICQTDLGFYDHKHQKIGNESQGLIKMSGDILETLLRVIIEVDHIEVSKDFLMSLQILYQRYAQDTIRKYHTDAHFNNLKYDRHMEEQMVEEFSKQLMISGNHYLRHPVGTRIPDWLRTIAARKKIREQLLDIVIIDNEK